MIRIEYFIEQQNAKRKAPSPLTQENSAATGKGEPSAPPKSPSPEILKGDQGDEARAVPA
jgi:hypothetical protein